MDKILPKFKGMKAYEEELASEANEEKNSVKKVMKKINSEMDSKIKIVSNEKRLQSLKERLDLDKRQQLLVKEAINSGKRVNKRIVFDLEDIESDVKDNDISSEDKQKSNDNSIVKSKPKAKQLFESDSEDDDNDVSEDTDGMGTNERLKAFETDLNKKINDKNAEKLIELNSRFAHDLRFRIDERFLDQTEDNEEVLDEKQKNLNLLEEVLGKRLKPIIKTKDKSTEKQNNLFVSRFDPNSDKSSEYEVNNRSDEKSRRKVSFDPKVVVKEVDKSRGVDKTSTEVYYEVSSALKDSLAQKEEEFSLTQMFGTNSTSAESEDKSSDDRTVKPFYDKLNTNKRKLDVLPNPFRYDSSSSGEEEEEEEDEDDIEVVVGSDDKSKAEDKAKPFFNNSFKFFFAKNDSRFNEDLFYSKELIEKAKNSWKDRQRLIIRSMSVRKRSAKKNKKSEQKSFKTKYNQNYKRFKQT